MTTKRSRLGVSVAVDVINEQARQIKQAGEPGDDEDDVKSFQPQYEHEPSINDYRAGLVTWSHDGLAAAADHLPDILWDARDSQSAAARATLVVDGHRSDPAVGHCGPHLFRRSQWAGVAVGVDTLFSHI